MVCITNNDGLYFDLSQVTLTLQRVSLSPRLKYEKTIIHIGRPRK